eukprot:TRINITY_DN69088_c0_g1_i1.p2 TRINITY_DN69088_c0_g1~~TRINITY_DN69088_c0_g1_i1.p2  ORF type:complete len:283 (-),score=86.94 TRINITY_DN69088_c0_g1_i1:180-1028(-)
MERVLENLDAAESAADGAKSKLKEQNARLEKMGMHMNEVNEVLNQTDEQVAHLESKYGYGSVEHKEYEAFKKGGPGDGSGGEGGARQQSTQIERPRKEGWLLKRGAKFGSEWKKAWCRLFSDALVLYTSSNCTELIRAIPMSFSVKCYSFNKMKAPGEACRHRGEKPFGFVVFSPGTSEPYTYLEGQGQDELVEWTEAIRRRVKKLDPCRMKKMMESADGDDNKAMALINQKLEGLQDKAEDIRELADEQGELIDSVQNKVDVSLDRIKDQNQRLEKHVEED